MGDFIAALIQEIKLRKTEFIESTIETIYFGGGTPSMLKKSEIDLVLETIFENYNLSKSPEITLEANPDDLTDDYIQQLTTSQVNRLSIGIQSFDDAILKQINRRHTSIQAINAIELAQKSGFNNLSIDLIYGIPNQSDETWLANLETTKQNKIPHLSCYALTVEENTAMHRMIGKKLLPEPQEEDSIRQFNLLMDFAEENGYRQYEISNFCLDGKISKHNSAYWNGSPYIGFGPGAHSFDGKNRRKWNVSDVKKYIEGVQTKLLNSEFEILSEDDCYNEYIMTSIRTDSGCNFSEITNRFGTPYLVHFEKQLKTINSELFVQNNDIIYLSKEGKFLSDFITRTLFY
jgi:oxygen-independent coproporphyrinogen-3 oxidase